MQETFQAIFKFDEDAEVGDLGDGSLDNHSRAICTWNRFNPRIFRQLLDAKTNALLLLIDFDDHALDLVALLKGFVWMRDFLGPRHVRDVQQSVDASFDLDERAIVGEISDFTGDDRSKWIMLCNKIPWIHFALLHAERDFQFVLVEVENDNIDLLFCRDDFAWMIDASSPRHFADVHESFDAIFESHECAV